MGAVNARRSSSAQILIGQCGAPGRDERGRGGYPICGSLVGQFIIGFKLGIGAAEYAPAAAVSIAKAESLMVCRAMLVFLNG